MQCLRHGHQVDGPCGQPARFSRRHAVLDVFARDRLRDLIRTSIRGDHAVEVAAEIARRLPIPCRTVPRETPPRNERQDRKSTRLNSSHSQISYAVCCLKKKKTVAEL